MDVTTQSLVFEFKEINLDSVDPMFGEPVITTIKWADAIFYNLARCDMNCINIIPFCPLVCLALRRVLYARRHGIVMVSALCTLCAISLVYDGVLTLTVKDPISTSMSMDTTAMACDYELDV
jgi:hypothetical protein